MPRPWLILDENVVMQNDLHRRQGWDYERAGARLKELLRAEGVEATFVGDRDPAVDIQDVKPHYWAPLRGAAHVAAIGDCARRFAAAPAASDEERERGFKACTRDAAKRVAARIPGCTPCKVPPRGARDGDIADWADRNGAIVASFDADAELEPSVSADRILLSTPEVDCGPHAKRVCDADTEKELALVAGHVKERLARVLGRLKAMERGAPASGPASTPARAQAQ